MVVAIEGGIGVGPESLREEKDVAGEREECGFVRGGE
jgi:hypothetical protein